MSFEQLFSSASTLAMFGWVILVFLPRRWKWLNRIPALFIPVILSVLYSFLIARYFFAAEGGFDTLANVQQLFTYPGAALAGWVHYLAFDLFIGGLIAKQADEIGLSRLIQAPILLLTFMFGPFGYLLFTIIKPAMLRFKSKEIPSEEGGQL
uniref:Integral membrane protein n=1 Tax=uncultured Thiotrichaceae bacterium TaxID=298394 RepID=A0A6S6T323_9GAMM|nr:MAG: Putative integral membrane protein [uncultured Thiotrichaceae bacterium]